MAPSPSEGPFAVPRRVADLMAGFSRPWYLAGGWALDVWLGRVTRPHEDVEIAILRDEQEEIRRHLDGWEFDKVAHGVGAREVSDGGKGSDSNSRCTRSMRDAAGAILASSRSC